jgi:hypothetical protein
MLAKFGTKPKQKAIWETNTSEQRETNTENIWPKPYEIKFKKLKCEEYEGIVGRTWRICGKAYGIKMWIQIENRCRSRVNEHTHTQIYWPKPKKSSSSSRRTYPPPQAEIPTPNGKRKRKKKQVLLLFALPHWVPKKYLPH